MINVTHAMVVFIFLIAMTSFVLDAYGGPATLYFASLFFLVGMIMKIRIRKRRTGAEAEQISLDDIPEEYRTAAGLPSIRKELAEQTFRHFHSWIFDDIGRYVEIYAAGDIFAEIIVDEEDQQPRLGLHTFFKNGLLVNTELADNQELNFLSMGKNEHHWLPGESLLNGLKFHRARVKSIILNGLDVVHPKINEYDEERLRHMDNVEELE